MFASLHNHSCYSLLDSISKTEDMIKKAKELNYSAIAITDHGNLHNFINFYKEGQKQEIKTIIGIELYECDDINIKDDTRYHLIVLAKNNDGLKALYKISSESYLRGFYYKPRCDINIIAPYAENLIILSACMAGRIARLILENTNKAYKQALDWLNKYKQIFPNFYLEMQSHRTDEQKFLNLNLLQLAQETNTPYVITLDTHMINKEDLEAHSIFVEIEQEREIGESYIDCYFQPIEEIYNIMNDHIGYDNVRVGLENSIKIAKMCNVTIDLNMPNQMPKINIPQGYETINDYYKHLIQEGWKKRGIHKLSKEQQKIYRERVLYEYDVLDYLGYIDYFVMLRQLVDKAKERNIPLGYSRGSGGNCLSLYLLGVTEVDSVRWNLDFSRFGTKGRKSAPDYDMDISKARRKEMIEIAKELFGEENVAPICTFNTFSRKVAVRDIGKVLDQRGIYQIPYNIRDKVAKIIPTKGNLKEAIEITPGLKDLYKQFPLWFDYVEKLEELPKSLGQHAAGVLLTPKPITEYCPLCLNKEKEPMIQLEMHNAMDDLHLVKMDFLGLNTVDVVDHTLKLAGLTWDDIDLGKLDLEDKDVYREVFASGNTLGVFQFESHESISLLQKIKPDNIEDIFSVNSLNRPAILSVGMHNTYIKNKNNPSEIKYIHPDMKEITKNTYGVCMYQEQALALFRLAGFPDEEVDNARRAIGHKESETMAKLKDKFIQELLNRGWTLEQINEVWQLLEAQSSYSFNKGHCTAYGLLSYVTAYLKYYYPVEFMTALLTSEKGNYQQIGKYINECNRLGIQVLPPSINHSQPDFSINNKAILFGLSMVKNVGDANVENIIQNRPYTSFQDFLQRTNIDTTCIVALIKAGAFNEFETDKNKLLLQYAESQYTPLKFSPNTTINKEQKDILLEKGWITKKQYEDNEFCLRKYNEYKKQQTKIKNKKRFEKHLEEFKQKYISDNLADYEMQALSMYFTTDPYKDVRHILKPFSEIKDQTENILAGTIIDIKYKTDKRKQRYAYIDLLNPEGNIVECIAWASVYSKYQDIIKKGIKIVSIGKKDGTKFFFKELKFYDDWVKQIKKEG